MSHLDDLERKVIALAVVKHVKDAAFWHLPEGTLIVARGKPGKVVGHKDGKIEVEHKAKAGTYRTMYARSSIEVSQRPPGQEDIQKAKSSPQVSRRESNRKIIAAHSPYGKQVAADKAAVAEKARHDDLQKGGMFARAKLIVAQRKGRHSGTGTLIDPVDVKGNVDLAARMIAEGKHVRLNHVDEVGTLLDKLLVMTNEAKAKGKDAPTYNLCLVSVPKTNLFCAQHKGVPRVEMPQFKGKKIRPGSFADGLPRNKDGEVDIEQHWRDHLDSIGVTRTMLTVKADHLKASQMELQGDKVAGMTGAIDKGLMKPASIFTTEDGYIVDGHHRWAANVAHDAKDGKLGEITMEVEQLNIEIGQALDLANNFALSMGLLPSGISGTPEASVPDKPHHIADLRRKLKHHHADAVRARADVVRGRAQAKADAAKATKKLADYEAKSGKW